MRPEHSTSRRIEVLRGTVDRGCGRDFTRFRTPEELVPVVISEAATA